MIKKFLVNSCLIVIGYLVLTQTSHAYCLVSSESGSNTNVYTLPYKVKTHYSGKGTEATCTTGSTDNYDDYYGLEQAIMFATLEWGYSNDVNAITLNGALSFDNPDENLVIGNFSEESPPTDIDYAYDYASAASSGTFVPVVDDYGAVTINAKDNFDADEQPFTCASGTEVVVLRNLIILTNGINKDDFFANASCLRDGGTVYVCGGEIDETKQPGESGWCSEETDNDGDGWTVDEGDCDDDDADINPDAEEIPGNGIDENCDGQDGDCTLTVTGPTTLESTDEETYTLTLTNQYHSEELYISVTDGESTVTESYPSDRYLASGRSMDITVKTANTAAGDYTFTFKAGYPNSTSRPFAANFDPAFAKEVATDADTGTFYAAAPGSITTMVSAISFYNQVCTVDYAVTVSAATTDTDDDGDGYYEDDDGDGDCNDTSVCDCDDTDATKTTDCSEGGYTDDDGDGYCEDATTCTDGSTPGDCDDTDPDINPAASEICDGVDNNCDGGIDDTDADGDGFDVCSDCDDGDASVSPSTTEVCADGVDNDCDNTVDETPTWYADADGDGFGDPNTTLESCDAVDGYVDDDTDCNDADAGVNPDAIPTGEDEDALLDFCANDGDMNCDGLTDSEDPLCEGTEIPVCAGGVEDCGYLEGGSGCGCDLTAAGVGMNSTQLIMMLMALAPMTLVGGFRWKLVRVKKK